MRKKIRTNLTNANLRRISTFQEFWDAATAFIRDVGSLTDEEQLDIFNSSTLSPISEVSTVYRANNNDSQSELEDIKSKYHKIPYNYSERRPIKDPTLQPIYFCM